MPPFLQEPETVAIDFDGRRFVWHVLKDKLLDSVFGDRDVGPSLVTVLRTAADFDDAATEAERFLSVLSYYYGQPAEAVAYGTSSGVDPWQPPVTRAERTHVGWMMTEPYEAMFLERDPRLLVALGYHREAQNAGSPFYRFLASWNCLDAVFNVTRNESKARDAFLDTVVPNYRARWDDRYRFPSNPAVYFRDESRNAIAHAIRDPGARQIDPDNGNDRRRLESESQFLLLIAREAIRQEYPHAVSAADSHPTSRR